ncbi:MAG: nicotinate-nucleotide--dimethylbenzimidazole phosphoribosyltransferase [Pseudonocardiales bacterium]|nr:nicotinate-nucleotide--dimethylbenzimidazole phosphoribosyltransferase [Pseudonocardiales bacterium]
MGSRATDLLTLGEGVEWSSFEAAAAAHEAVDPRYGRLGDLVEWLAGAQGAADPRSPTRPRCVVFGTAGEAARALAATLDVGLREVRLDPAATVPDALALGVAAADEEVDAGADLIVVVDGDDSAASALSVSLLAGVEPVALLPRGAAAIDTAAWIARAEYLRDARRTVAGLRDDPAGLLTALGHAPLAATSGFVLRATARRTPLVLDGSTAAAAALICHHVQPRSSRWWRFADSSPDALHGRVLAELGQRPLLDLAISAGDGTAGLLTLPLLRAAVGGHVGSQG